MSDPGWPASARPQKSAAAFRTIGEVADELDLPAHVLRFWETKFSQLKPVKRSGGRRYYRPEDILLLRRIRQWLYQDGYTIRGVQQLLGNRPPHSAAAGEDPDIADPCAAASPEAGIGADPGCEFPAAPDSGATDRSQTAALPASDRKPASLDPETRAELEEIRRELLETRALLDTLPRRFRAS
ncbi:MAG: MerR family transcriptional regulator [Alphaproteobacteria bacterium]